MNGPSLSLSPGHGREGEEESPLRLGEAGGRGDRRGCRGRRTAAYVHGPPCFHVRRRDIRAVTAIRGSPRLARAELIALRGDREKKTALSCQTVGTVPPSITYSVPVIDAAREEARKTTRSATSLGFAGRPIGMPPSESINIRRAPA